MFTSREVIGGRCSRTKRALCFKLYLSHSVADAFQISARSEDTAALYISPSTSQFVVFQEASIVRCRGKVKEREEVTTRRCLGHGDSICRTREVHGRIPVPEPQVRLRSRKYYSAAHPFCFVCPASPNNVPLTTRDNSAPTPELENSHSVEPSSLLRQQPKMARGNQRENAREKNAAKMAGQVSRHSDPSYRDSTNRANRKTRPP